MFLVEYKIQNFKQFLSEWEVVREHYPQKTELVNVIVGKHGEIAISLWKAPPEKVIHEFHKKYFDRVAEWKILEVDHYHSEGFHYRKSA
jgi:hypothetical protein